MRPHPVFFSLVRSIVICVLIHAALYADPPQGAGGEADELVLVTGEVRKGTIKAETAQNIIFQALGKKEEQVVPLSGINIIRSATGEYRLINHKTPEETPQAAKEVPTKPDRTNFTLVAAGSLQYSKNADLSSYQSDFSNYLATLMNTNNTPGGYTNTTNAEQSKLSWGASGEARFSGRRLTLGLSSGYAQLNQLQSTVSSPNYANKYSVTFDTNFIPSYAIIYYSLNLSERWRINLGFGAGVLFSRTRFVITDGSAFNQKQTFISWNPALIFKPEIQFQTGRISFLLSIPVQWAEAKKMVSGDDTLINGYSLNVVSPGLTGVGVMLGVGFQIY